MVTFQPEKAWAAAWIDGSPRPFICESTTRALRRDAQKAIGELWAHEGETWQQGWRRAYRNNCRCIRVMVSQVQ